MIKRIAFAAISYEVLLEEYQKDYNIVIDLLKQRNDGKPQLIKNKKFLRNILNWINNYIIIRLKKIQCNNLIINTQPPFFG